MHSRILLFKVCNTILMFDIIPWPCPLVYYKHTYAVRQSNNMFRRFNILVFESSIIIQFIDMCVNRFLQYGYHADTSISIIFLRRLMVIPDTYLFDEIKSGVRNFIYFNISVLFIIDGIMFGVLLIVVVFW